MKAASIVEYFRPPHPTDYDEPEKYVVAVRRWQYRTWYGLAGLWIAFVSTVALSFGMVPKVYAGFASAFDQQATQSDVQSILVGQLENQIFNLRKDHCAALKEGRPGIGYWERLQPLLRQYETLTGKPFILPACNEL